MSLPSITCRPASTRDRDWLFFLRRQTMREYVEAMFGWDDRAQRRWVYEQCPLGEIRIVQADGSDIGLLHLEEHPDHLFLANIQLLPQYQRRGIGSHIINRVVRDAEAKGKPVQLQVLHVNPARALYERLGFRVYQETPTHLRMVRPLGGAPPAKRNPYPPA
jgi:ribosomal protein S18 acetylase RimI-like enzyme